MHDEAAQGVEAVLVLARQFLVDVELRFQALDTDVSIDQPRAVFPLDDVALLRRFRFVQLTDDRGQHVGQRHHTFDFAVLVDDQCKLHAGTAEILEQLRCRHRFRHEERRAQCGLDVGDPDGLAVHRVLQQVALLQHAEDVIEAVSADHQARVLALHDLKARQLLAVVEVDHAHIAARRHDRRDRLLVEAQHVGNDGLLTFVENARHGALLHEYLDFVVGHRRLFLATGAEETQNDRCRR